MSSGDDNMGGVELNVRVTYRGSGREDDPRTWKRGCNMMSVEVRVIFG